MAGSGKIQYLLHDELAQLSEEGREIDREVWKKEIEKCGSDRDKLMAVYEKLQALPMRTDYPYEEPSAHS